MDGFVAIGVSLAAQMAGRRYDLFADDALDRLGNRLAKFETICHGFVTVLLQVNSCAAWPDRLLLSSNSLDAVYVPSCGLV